MKFHLKSKEQRASDKEKRLSEWHRWFAWKPIRMTPESTEVRWLEFIYRKKVRAWSAGKDFDWKYIESAFDILKDQSKK